MKKHRKIRLLIFLFSGCLIAGLFAVEFYLRFYWGFCDAVLMRPDDDYEYIAQPNQKRFRFRKHIFYNSHSMRGGELRPGSLRILCVGDSVLNGGTLTDQGELATEILSQRVSAQTGKDVQVLNVSAGSWGPDNCAAYLRKHGLFDARLLILITSSHDAHDVMNFMPVVGILKYYPEKQYPLALFELYDRYLCPQSALFQHPGNKIGQDFRTEHHIEHSSDDFNPGFQQLMELAQQYNIPWVIYLHAEKQELAARRYNDYGQEIIAFARKNQIPLICDLESGLDETWFRDPVHYNAKGQQKMAELLQNVLKKHFVFP